MCTYINPVSAFIIIIYIILILKMIAFIIRAHIILLEFRFMMLLRHVILVGHSPTSRFGIYMYQDLIAGVVE